jgi:chemotaxis protein CheD
MKSIMIGIGEYDATHKVGEQVKTMALGSCVAVVILDPSIHCVGMAHIALPDSRTNPEKAIEYPGYFADTGIPALLNRVRELGGSCNSHGLIVKLIGGATVIDHSNTFNIGKRNQLAVKKVLWKYGMGAVREDLGGKISRTVAVDVDCGRVRVSSPGRDSWEI